MLVPAKTPSKPVVVACPDHGEQRWQGDLRCGHCGQAYPVGDGLTPVPDWCACKSRLLPDENNRRTKWTAAMACPVCMLSLKVM